jgi:hypothetical protein
MSEFERHFKNIDFEKEWSEKDWARFFAAQDRLLFELEVRARHSPVSKTHRRDSLDDVMKRLGVARGDDVVVPAELDIPDDPLQDTSLRMNIKLLPEDALPVERLPLYQLSLLCAQKVLWLLEYRYHALARKPYKSARHVQTQKALFALQEHVVKISHYIALGHELGYSGDRIHGNVVRLTSALGYADRCLGAATKLVPGVITPRDAASLFRWTLRLRNDLFNWIHRLRKAAQ